MMIAQPSLAFESPLLLLLPPVFVAPVSLHSGFQCWLLSLCSLLMMFTRLAARKPSCWWKTLGILTLSIMPLTNYSMPIVNNLKKHNNNNNKKTLLSPRSGFFLTNGPSRNLLPHCFLANCSLTQKDEGTTFWVAVSCFYMVGKRAASGLCANAISELLNQEQAAENIQHRNYCQMKSYNHWIPV